TTMVFIPCLLWWRPADSRAPGPSRPGIRRVGDGVEVARREALEPERVEQARVLPHEHLRDLAADADHLVAMVRVEDRVEVRAQEVEDGEIVGRERADAAGARLLVELAAA